jgi:hypothetical protein
MPSWHQTQSANEERRTNTTAWATNEQPGRRMLIMTNTNTTAIPPPPGLSTPIATRAPRQVPQQPVGSSPPGLLSVKAEPFQPSGGRIVMQQQQQQQPTTPRLVPAPVSSSTPSPTFGSFYQPQPQPQPEAPASYEHSDDSHLEMSMLALSHQMSQFALGGDM